MENSKPLTVRGTIKGTGLPLDGHTVVLGFWDYDQHSQAHLLSWEDDADEAVMRTMHKTDELYRDMPLEKFKQIWDSGEYDPDGVFCIDPECVQIVEINASANNVHDSAVVQNNRANSLVVQNGSSESQSPEEIELLRIFKGLDVKGRIALLAAAYDIETKEGSGR